MAKSASVQGILRVIAMIGLVGLLAVAFAPATAQAALVTYTWTPTAAGTYNWNDAANWGGVAFPNSGGSVNGHRATLSNNILGDQTVQLNQLISLYRMDIGDTGSGTDNSYNVVANGGSFVFDNGATAFTLSGVGTAAAGNSIAADIQLNSNLTVDNPASNLLTISGNITTSTAKTLTKSSLGTLVLTGTNTFASTILSGGTLQVNSDAALGTAPGSAATNITISGASTLQFAANMTGGSGLNATRTINLSGTGGTLDTQGFNVDVGGAITGGNALTKAGSGTLTVAGTGTTGTLTVNNGTLTVGGVLTAGSVNVNAGTLALSSGGTMSGLTVGPTATMTTGGAISGFTGATINGALTASANVTLSSVSDLEVGGTLTMTAGTLSVTRGNGGFTGHVNSGGSILLQGSSIFSIGNQSNSNFIVASGGTLDVGPSASETGGASLTIDGTLRGSGTIGSRVTIDASAHLVPGASVGTMTLSNTLTVAAGGILDFEFNDTTPAHDKVLVTLSNGLTFSGTVGTPIVLNVYQEGTTNLYTTAGTYDLFQYVGTAPSLANITLPNANYSLSTGASDGLLGNAGDTGNWVKLTIAPVPEPATLAFLAIGGMVMAVGGVIRRRRTA